MTENFDISVHLSNGSGSISVRRRKQVPVRYLISGDGINKYKYVDKKNNG
jgi:hypothetical protein